MKCRKCGIELSASVCIIHETICKKDVKPEVKTIDNESDNIDSEPVEEDLNIKQDDYTLDQLLQMCIDNQDIKKSPSTIKRWKEPRARKELGI